MRFVIAVSAVLCLAGFPLYQAEEVNPQSRRLRKDLEFLYAHELAGRVSLSKEADVAARYIAADFKASGLQPASAGSYLQEFPLIGHRADPKKRALTLTRGGSAKKFTPGTDFTGAFSREVRVGAPVFCRIWHLSA